MHWMEGEEALHVCNQSISLDEMVEPLLPLDALAQIFGRLPARSLCLCCCVSHSWRAAAETDWLWKQAYLTEFGSVFPDLSHSVLRASLALPPAASSWRHLFHEACASIHRPYLALAGQMQSAIQRIASWRALVRRANTSANRAGPAGTAALGSHGWRAFPVNISTLATQSVWLRFTLPAGMIHLDDTEGSYDVILQGMLDELGGASCRQGPSSGLVSNLSAAVEQGWEQECEAECFLDEEEEASLERFLARGDSRRNEASKDRHAADGMHRSRCGCRAWFPVIRAVGFEVMKDHEFVSEKRMFHQAHVTGIYAYKALPEEAGDRGDREAARTGPLPVGTHPAIRFIAYIHTEQLLPILPFLLPQSLSCTPPQPASRSSPARQPTSPQITERRPTSSPSFLTSDLPSSITTDVLRASHKEASQGYASSSSLLTSASDLTTSLSQGLASVEQWPAALGAELAAGEYSGGLSPAIGSGLSQVPGPGRFSQSEAAILGAEQLLVQPLKVYLDFIAAEDSSHVARCYAAMWLHSIRPRGDGDYPSLLWEGPIESITPGTTLAELADGEVMADITLFTSLGPLLLGRAGTELWQGEGGRITTLHFIPDDSRDELFDNGVRLCPGICEKLEVDQTKQTGFLTVDMRKYRAAMQGKWLFAANASEDIHAEVTRDSPSRVQESRIQLYLTLDGACRTFRFSSAAQDVLKPRTEGLNSSTEIS